MTNNLFLCRQKENMSKFDMSVPWLNALSDTSCTSIDYFQEKQMCCVNSWSTEGQISCGQVKNTGQGGQEKAKTWVITRTNSQFSGIRTELDSTFFAIK